MKLSKHHYALELASRGHEVYFFEPANLKMDGVEKRQWKQNLWVVNYPLRARGRDKLPQIIYDFLIRHEVKWLVKQLQLQPDIVWCFDAERLNRLRYFNAAVKIFHPVDFFSDKVLLNNPDFDISFSTIKRQVNLLKQKGYPSYFINHGLSAEFIPYAKSRGRNEIVDGNATQRIKAGYVGNLLSEPPDRETMKKVIEQNPDVDFHFWGQYENQNSNLTSFNQPQVFSFIEYLKQRSHVFLHGPIDTASLARAMQEMNMFWVCWNITKPGSMWNKDTNPHKVIEYLSTGKPVAAHYIQQYADSELIDMVDNIENHGYCEVFKTCVAKVQGGENESLTKGRVEFALGNTYQTHINHIMQLVQSIPTGAGIN